MIRHDSNSLSYNFEVGFDKGGKWNYDELKKQSWESSQKKYWSQLVSKQGPGREIKEKKNTLWIGVKTPRAFAELDGPQQQRWLWSFRHGHQSSSHFSTVMGRSYGVTAYYLTPLIVFREPEYSSPPSPRRTVPRPSHTLGHARSSATRCPVHTPQFTMSNPFGGLQLFSGKKNQNNVRWLHQVELTFIPQRNLFPI